VTGNVLHQPDRRAVLCRKAATAIIEKRPGGVKEKTQDVVAPYGRPPLYGSSATYGL
jgi:hypothetical protein